MAKWIRHRTPNPGIAGSSPAEDVNLITKAFVAEWSKALDSSSSLFGGVGSNPTECIKEQLRWRNWIAHQTSNLGVVGSIPTRSVFCFGFVFLFEFRIN